VPSGAPAGGRVSVGSVRAGARGVCGVLRLGGSDGPGAGERRGGSRRVHAAP
jgi:hypothetical protein